MRLLSHLKKICQRIHFRTSMQKSSNPSKNGVNWDFCGFFIWAKSIIFFRIFVIKIVVRDTYIPNNIMKKNFGKIFGLGGRIDRRAQCAPPPPSQNRLSNTPVIIGLINGGSRGGGKGPCPPPPNSLKKFGTLIDN